MSVAFKEMIKGQALTGTPTAYYAAPTGTSATIQAATVSNATGGVVTVDLYKVPPAGAAAGTNKIATRSVPAGQTLTLNDAINHKLEPGSQLFAAGNGLGLTVSGVEYVPE